MYFTIVIRVTSQLRNYRLLNLSIKSPKTPPPEKLSCHYTPIIYIYTYICILLNPAKSYLIIFPSYHHDIPIISPCYINVDYYSQYIPIIAISHRVDFGDLGPFGAWFMALLYPHYLPMISPCCIPILIQKKIPILYSHDIPMITISHHIIPTWYSHIVFPWYPQYQIPFRELCSATAPPPLAQVPDPHAVVVAGRGKHCATRVEIHRHDLESFTVGFPSAWGWSIQQILSGKHTQKRWNITTLSRNINYFDGSFS